MKLAVRSFILLPVLIITLVAIPAVVMAAAGGHSASADITAGGGVAALAVGSDIDGHRPHGTVPPPTARPRPVPPKPVGGHYHPVYAKAKPAPARVAVAKIDNYKMTKVIGDRLSSTIYAYTDNGYLYRSDRNGNAWYLVTPSPMVDNFIMSAADPNVLYSGAGINCTNASATIAPMFKSEDGGYSWTELTTGSNMTPLLANPSDPDRVFAADCSTIYLSTNGGQTWSPKPAASDDNLWQTYAPVAMASGSLVGDPRPATPHWDQIFTVGNSVQGAGVVAFSGDQGKSWADITNPDKAPSGIKALDASLVDGGKVWVVDSKGVWSTSDYGVTWTFSNKGLSSLNRAFASPFNDITTADDGSLYVATDIGLYEQSEGSDTWVEVDKNSDSVPYAFDNHKLVSLLLTESSPRKMWINAVVNEGNDYNNRVFTFGVNP